MPPILNCAPFYLSTAVLQITLPSQLKRFVPQSTDTQSLARDTPYCARSTLVIVVQVR